MRSWEDRIEDNGEDRYYFHRSTGQSSWVEPPGWPEIIRANGGWTSCFDAESAFYFWWAEATGETVWADAQC